MSFTRGIALLAAVSLAAILAGCGDKTIAPSSVSSSTLEASGQCIDCHSTNLSPVTAASITEEWKLSAHNTSSAANRSKAGAGCADCHEPEPGHPSGNCARCHGGSVPNGPVITSNPDAAGKCLKCHTADFGYRTTQYGEVAVDSQRAHFNNVTSAGYPASYVTSSNGGNCRRCHNPHDTSSLITYNRDWSRSGKGDTKALPWTKYDFKTRGAASTSATPANSAATECVRCHTTTGYINFVSSGFTDIHAWGVGSDKTKETLECRACHVNTYRFSDLRSVPPVVRYYNMSSASTGRIISGPVQYADVGTSNICLPCHTGRIRGATLEQVAAKGVSLNTFTFGTFNSHYLTAGATLFRVTGFHFYTSATEYANYPFFAHERIGVDNYSGTGTKGPCVTCHLIPGRHTFMPVEEDANGQVTAIANPVCANCHKQTAYGDYSWTPAKLNAERADYEEALAALADILAKNPMNPANKIYYYNASPYFFKVPVTGPSLATSANAFKNWGNVKTLGSAFNYNLLAHDPGAFAHNRRYAKRLIYDAIDHLDDGALNYSTGAWLSALPDSTGFKAGAIGYLLVTQAVDPGTGQTVAVPATGTGNPLQRP